MLRVLCRILAIHHRIVLNLMVLSLTIFIQVERSISHFKYEGRWDCQQLVKNDSFVPTEYNAKPFEAWRETKGFVKSPCDEPFSFTGCAVNCYIQTFAGEGCTSNEWQSEYELALNRLMRYNLIFVYERFKDEGYAQAIEDFFGVEGFNQASDMFCGWQAHEANKKVPLVVGFDHVMRLSKLNQMDTKLFKEATDCWGGDEVEYSFPKANANRFAAQQNRTVVE